MPSDIISNRYLCKISSQYWIALRPNLSFGLVHSVGFHWQIATKGEWQLYPTVPQNITNVFTSLNDGARNHSSYSELGGRPTWGQSPN